VRTSANNTAGYFGVRGVNNGPIVGETPFGALTGYTQLTVSFNSGPHSVLEVYGGMWAQGDTWVQLDDVSLTRGANLVGHAGFEQQPSSSASSHAAASRAPPRGSPP
jgi:D-arabinan endo alpha-(1,5)-arabinofuranosidase